ncbi:MAG: penicillin-binding protein 2 [Candidatus Woykebacteria bacterium]
MKNKLIKSFGFVFGENLQLSRRRKNIASSAEIEKAESWSESHKPKLNQGPLPSPWRLVPVYFIFSAFLVFLLARAFDLQVIQGDIFLGQAQGNYARLEANHAPRGVVFDRSGVILAQNKPGFRLFAEPKVIPSDKKKDILGSLAETLEVQESELSKKLNQASGDQVTLSNQITSDQALEIETKSDNWPGVGLEVNPIRYYPYKNTISHVVGYTTEADKSDLARRGLEPPYVLGDKVGRAGVESFFEDTLRGTNGYTLTTVAASGEKTGEIFRSPAKAGKNITLSVDIKLQEFIYKLLEKKIRSIGAKAASAVAMDPSTGEILALVSIPSFNNNLFSRRLTSERYEQLISNPNKLLLNRAVAAAYPPGSTFKMVTAAAGLETGTITAQTKIKDPGFITLGGRVFTNWLWTDQGRTEGSINVVRAIARSTDTFFYSIGQMMGEGNIQKYAKIFGLGSTTGAQLPEEIAGLVPTEEWKLATKGEPWYPGETLNISIGQGDLLTTPLQISIVTGVFANGGKLVVPTLLKTNQAKVQKSNFLSKKTIDVVREGLYQDTIGDGNVGWLFGDFKIKTAGKTGTAEAGEKGPHAWYTAYAPHPEAKIVVTVMIEHAGHGSEEAAPLVKEIFDWWFSHKN